MGPKLTLSCPKDSTPKALHRGRWFSLLCLWKLATMLLAAVCQGFFCPAGWLLFCVSTLSDWDRAAVAAA